MTTNQRFSRTISAGLVLLTAAGLSGCGDSSSRFSELWPGSGSSSSADIRGTASSDCGPEFGPDVSISSTTPVTIPDGGGAGNAVFQTLVATESFPIGALEVTLDVTHTWVGDLTIRLDHGGRTMRLVDRPLSPGVEFGCDQDNFVGVVLDQHGTGGNIEDACQANLTSPPSYVPVDNLDTFVGLDFAGEWKITAYDNEGDDFGTLDGWTVTARERIATCPECTDADSDGVTDCDGDCDDNNAGISPNAPELCDGQDNDCDTLIDDADPDATGQVTSYADNDADGYGDPDVSIQLCDTPPGFVLDGSDCDDQDAAINPDGAEVCDGLDNDCDGLTDDADPDVTGQQTFYADADADGFGDPAASTQACQAPPLHVTDNTDCDDQDASAFPGNTEVCDGVDNDCDGLVDDADDDVTDVPTWYPDGDSDGFGTAETDGEVSFDFPEAPSEDDLYSYRLGYPWMGYAGDSYTAYRSAAPLSTVDEVSFDFRVDQTYLFCNTYLLVYFDDEYLGSVYLSWYDWYTDVSGSVPVTPSDADPHEIRLELYSTVYSNKCWRSAVRLETDGGDMTLAGSTTVGGIQSCQAPAGYAGNSLDCDDDDAEVNPAAEESCNGQDDDCDGAIDEDAGDTFYLDEDGDGYGVGFDTTTSCGGVPEGYAAADGDCDDDDPTLNPGADEVCDGMDNDCDALIDDADPSVNADLWFADQDADGWGAQGSGIPSCTPLPGLVSNGLDCDDQDAAINPDATEVCDGLDNDCDGLVDDEDPSVEGQPSWWPDSDGDGMGNHGGPPVTFHAPAPPSQDDVYRYYYGYPYMAKAGDSYTAFRETPDLDYVDTVAIDMEVNTTYLYCYAYLLFYFDDQYLGYATLSPSYYTNQIEGELEVLPSAGQEHDLEIELYSTIYKSSCWYSYITLDTARSTLTLSQSGGGSPILSCEQPDGYAP